MPLPDALVVELVFTGMRGRPLGDDSPRRHWTAACDAVGISPEKLMQRFHNLRHTFATVCIDQNKAPKAIQAWIGRASIAVTMDVYGHLMDTSDDGAALGDDSVYGPLRSGNPSATPDETSG